jgi:hypothetical protein
VATAPPSVQDQPVGEQPPHVLLEGEHLATNGGQPAPVPQAEAKQETLSQAVNRKVREAKVAKGGKQARTLKEVRTFFEELTGPAEKPGVKRLAELLLKFIQGQLLDKTMAKHLNALFLNVAPQREQDTEPAPAVATQEPKPAQVGQDLPVIEIAGSELTDVA